jgi:hypothetical protein
MDTHHVPVWVLSRDEPYSAGSLLSPTGIDLFPKHGILWEKRKTVGDGHGNGEGHYVDRGQFGWDTGVSCARVWMPYGNISIGNRFVHCAGIARVLHRVTNLHR